MLRFVLNRLLQAVVVLLAVVTITFFMIRFAPGGPFDAEKETTAEIRRSLEQQYGLDRPLPLQYVNYVGDLFQGDLGPSFRYPNRSVSELIGESFPISAELGFWSLLIAIALGLAAGITASLRPNTLLDHIPNSLAIIGICVPAFVLGPLLVLAFALNLEWARVSGWDDWRDRVLPSVTLGAVYAAYIARLTRGGMLEILSQDFIRTARARGASDFRIITRHALRGGLLPVVSYLGPAAAGVITGSFVVEMIFQIPGLGRYFVNAAFNRDYTMVGGAVLFYAGLIVLFNIAVDIILVWMNPRLKFE